MNRKLVITAAIATAFQVAAATADDKLPENSLPLSEVVKTLEAGGYTAITEISLDHGVWEVETQKDGKKRELKVDPANAAILSDRPDD